MQVQAKKDDKMAELKEEMEKVEEEKVDKEERETVGVVAWRNSFLLAAHSRYENSPPFFLSEIISQMGETNFSFGPIPIFFCLFFDYDLLLPRIRAPQASFKAFEIS